jgi:hypothetical protein
MTNLDTVLASPPAVRLLLDKLRRQGRLQALIRDALEEQVIRQEADRAGL